jgi:hypothetical protein
MGFFKSMNELHKMGKEAQRNMDVGATMRNAQERMQAASTMMAQQTQAANLAAGAANGMDIEASILSMRQIGQMNFDPIVEFQLTALPPGLPPYPVTTTQTVNIAQWSTVQPGSVVKAKVDPQNPAAIWLNLAG